ncbi:uncharacterized protein Ir67a [Drosophila pseudoobscura]|uniref:Uncharacterized protein Ir67a n=1 Tax=Drosophila pseudoobscura pseudoobscura TaxID=46245 RepID=A0A6I8W3Z2_DROPS|nr:uncharacterized protein LOC4812741 [Drosophila pseudoobscura]
MAPRLLVDLQPFPCDMWQLLVLLLPLANTESELSGILDTIYADQPFETLLVLRHSQSQADEPDERLARAWPVLSFDEQMDCYLSGSYNNEMLGLVWQSGGNNEMNMELWQALDRNLQNMRHVRLLVVMSTLEGQQLQQIADTAEPLKFLQVAVLTSQGTVYRMQPFAQQHWVEIDPRREPIFARIRNYQRKAIITLPDQFAPRSLVYEDTHTQERGMTGYVAKLVMEFARIYNLTIQWQRPIVPGEHMSLILLRNLTLNGTISLPISLCGYEVPSESGVFSVPFDLEKWFIMVPCADEISTADVYGFVCGKKFLGIVAGFYFIFSLLDTCFGYLLLQRGISWSTLAFNERIISGMIGQSFKMSAHNTISSRVAHSQLFLLGLVLSTLFAAHLKTLLTKRPPDQQISNFQQLRDAPVDIYFDEAEHFYLDGFRGARTVELIRSKIRYVSTADFQYLRSTLNKSQAFSALTAEWLIIAKRQQYFQRPAFCSLPGLIFASKIILSLPMQANSIFERPINRLILYVHSSGLLEYWKQQTLYEMVALGLIPQEDPYPYAAFREFKVADLTWVWVLLGACLLLSWLIFLCEYFAYSLQRKKISKIHLQSM